jgi:2-hydroxy-6-oxonona-2,4-dienedioate hydrolase
MMHDGSVAGELLRIEGLGSRHAVLHRDRSVVWRRFGDGPPLVLLHGGHGSWLHWIRNIEPLSRRYTVWLPDMPGYGDSDELGGEPHDDGRMDRLLDAITATLASLLGDTTAVSMAGFSFGGLVAAQVATRYPVRRLALVGCAGHGGERRLGTPLMNWRVPDRSQQLAAFKQNLGALMLHDAAALDHMALHIYEMQCHGTRFRSQSLSRGGDLQDALARFGGPTLLMWGEHDVTAVPEKLAPQLAAGHEDCAWSIIGGAGHWAQYERDSDVSSQLSSWFSER